MKLSFFLCLSIFLDKKKNKKIKILEGVEYLCYDREFEWFNIKYNCQRAASRRSEAARRQPIIKPCAKVPRQNKSPDRGLNESRINVTKSNVRY